MTSPSSTRSPASAAPPPSVLRDAVTQAVRRYLADLDGHCDGDLHAVILREVEAPLLREVVLHFEGNQTRAAATLGINRATLRKRIKDLGLGLIPPASL